MEHEQKQSLYQSTYVEASRNIMYFKREKKQRIEKNMNEKKNSKQTEHKKTLAEQRK